MTMSLLNISMLMVNIMDNQEKEWLEKAIKLDLNLYIYEEYAKTIADLIYVKVQRDYWRKDYKPIFIRVISNLRTSYELGRPIHYSRNAHHYPKRGIGYRVLINLIDTMIEEKLLEQKNGYYDEDFGGKQSRIWSSEDLISLFIAIQPEDVVKEPPERLVELRDRNSKGIIEYNRSNEIISMVNQLEDYGNEAQMCSDLSNFLCAAFSTNGSSIFVYAFDA